MRKVETGIIISYTAKLVKLNEELREENDKGRTLAVPGFAFYDIMSLKEKQVAASRHLFFWAH